MGYGLRFPILSSSNWKQIQNHLLTYFQDNPTFNKWQILVTDCHPSIEYDELSTLSNYKKYYDVDLTLPTILVIGSESTGVSHEVSSF